MAAGRRDLVPRPAMVMAYGASALLERSHEIGLLENAWRRAASGHGSAWLLCAEAGGGKTRLVAEFAASVGRDRLRWGAAEPVAPPDPYLAVSRALPDFTPAPSRAESVARAVALLREADGPILLVLDDLHYADEGTVAVLVRLAAEGASQPWLVLAAFRPEEGTLALREGAAELAAQGQATRLNLAPLSRDAVGDLATAIRRRPVEPPELDALYADSGGNPWFAEALARGNGAVNAARDRIILRIERIDRAIPGALALLRALAPAARQLPHDLVATLHASDSRDLHRALAGLRDAGLLREGDDGWSYRHELLRRSILDSMLAAERREVHRTLAEALERWEPEAGNWEAGARYDTPPAHSPAPGSRLPAPATRRTSAAEIAMHFAEAGDDRAVEWALRAAEEARAIDAHAEAFAQVERALRFEMEPERRRTALAMAAREAYELGRPAEVLALVEEAVAIPGEAPDMIAALHYQAARAAGMLGDQAADEAHLAAAERVLAGQPNSRTLASIALARVSRVAIYVQPDRIAGATERALRLARELEPREAAIIESQVQAFVAVSLLDCGDPQGLDRLEEAERLVREHGLPPGIAVTALVNAYEEAVLSLFHDAAAAIYERVVEAMGRHGMDWLALVQPSRALELAQRGCYAEVRAVLATLPPQPPATTGGALIACVPAICEARAGSPKRARSLLAADPPASSFQPAALHDLARLDVLTAAGAPGLGETAQRIYGVMNRHRYARIAGVAAVAMARAGRSAAPVPPWLVADSPLRVFWEWAAGIDRADGPLLRDVAGRLTAMALPYEAALALRDAGDLDGAYRAFRALEATQAREETAALLRVAGRPVPRHTRAAERAGGLTDTEREVTRLVATGRSNEEIAAALGISVRTVTTHLTRIFAKTGSQGRTQLVVWWMEREVG